MPEKVKLSLTGGTGLSMSDLLDCPMKVKNKKDGWIRKLTPLYFLEGSIFHYAAEHIVEGDKFKSMKEVGEFIKETCGEYQETPEGERFISPGQWTNPDSGQTTVYDGKALQYPKKILVKTNKPSPITKVENMAKRIPHQIAQIHLAKAAGKFKLVRETERYVQIPALIDPETNSLDDWSKRIQDTGIVFSGRIDLDEPTNPKDFKTTDPQKAKEMGRVYRTQLTTYGYLKTVVDGVMSNAPGIHAFTKHISYSKYFYDEIELKVKDYILIYELFKAAGKQYIRLCNVEKKNARNGTSDWNVLKTGFLANGCTDNFMQKCPYYCICWKDKYKSKKKWEEDVANLRNTK